MKLAILLQFAGASHLALLAAGILMPRVVGMNAELRKVPPFLRNLFWSYYLFIGATIISFGVLTFLFAEQLASGHPIARAAAVVLAVLWLLRLAFAFVTDVSEYLKTPLHKAGYYSLNALFVVLIVIYAIAAFTPNL